MSDENGTAPAVPAFPWSQTVGHAGKIRELYRNASPELRRQALRAEHRNGSSNEIAALFGVTRNVVIGQWQRGGLVGAYRAPTRPLPETKDASTGRLDMRGSLSISGTHGAHIGDKSRERKGNNPLGQNGAIWKPRALRTAPPAVREVAGAAEPLPAAPATRFECRGVDLADLVHGECRYEIGPAYAEPQTFKFCGLQVVKEGVPWCLHHFILTRDKTLREVGLRRIGYSRREIPAVLAQFAAERAA